MLSTGQCVDMGKLRLPIGINRKGFEIPILIEQNSE